MNPKMVGACAVVGACVIVLSSLARADPAEFAVSLGYGHFSIDSKATELNEQDGIRTEFRFTGSPFAKLSQFRLGIGLGMSGYWQDFNDGDSFEIGNDIIIIQGDTYESIFLLEPEVQVSWRQPLGKHFYIEPGVGLGGVIGNFTTGASFAGFLDQDRSDWAANFSARPYLRAAWHNDAIAIGAETSYLWSDLDFGKDVSGPVTEFYAGVFVSFSL